MKRTICLLLALLSVVSVLTINIGAVNNDDGLTTEQPLTIKDCEDMDLEQIFYLAASGLMELENPGESQEPQSGDPESEEPEEQKEYDPNHVADFYLMCNASGFPSLGHVWVYVENVSPRDIQVGCYTCPPGEGVSIGCFGLTRSDGFGIYYNIESYCGNLFPEKLVKCFHVKTEMNEEQTNKVSNKILHSNWWDPMIVNCCFFALSTWNKAGGKWRFPWTCFPFFAKLGIKRTGEPGVSMFDPGRDRVYKQKGGGGKARLEPVKDGSVDTVPG